MEFIQTDVLARYELSKGKDVALTTGADENSLKNVQAAEARGTTPAQFCETNAAIFRKLAEQLELSFTSFIRSSVKAEHWAGPQKLWQLCDKNEDIYKKKYRGLYCVGCECFYEEKELHDGICPEHKIKPEIVEEENYFFKLSKYQKKLEQLIESDELRIVPNSKKNEAVSFIKSGLEDFSISRSISRAKGWGVPVPEDDTQIQYVWFDALSVYLTGVGYGKDVVTFSKYWPADVHVIGKGILRFHAIYWPAILLSAGIDLPKSIFVHGYITIDGQKMSKTLGNIVDPFYLIDKYGVDTLRYCLLSGISTFEDGDFSERVLIEKCNNELVANVGNLVNRTLVFIKNNYNETVPSFACKEIPSFPEFHNPKIKKITASLDSMDIQKAIHEIMELSSEWNKFFQIKKPWEGVKATVPEGELNDKANEAKIVIYFLVNAVKDLAILLEPYLPKTSKEIFTQLAIESRRWTDLGELSIEQGHRIGVPRILFKKLEQKEIDALHSKYSGKQAAQPQQLRFSDLDIEVGEIIEVEKHPNAEKLYVEKVQLSDGVRQLVSGIAKHYFPEQLLHRKVLVLRNLKPASLRGVTSEGMILAAENKEGRLEVVSLKKSKIGEKITLAGETPKPKPEISIDDFFKIEIKVERQQVIAEGKQLLTDSEEIQTEEVIDGKIG